MQHHTKPYRNRKEKIVLISKFCYLRLQKSNGRDQGIVSAVKVKN